jgi:hypothetical protein
MQNERMKEPKDIKTKESSKESSKNLKHNDLKKETQKEK